MPEAPIPERGARRAQPAVLSSAAARALLRKLRDLNLTASPVQIDPQLRVSIEGCLTLDAPVESQLRYRLRLADGRGSRVLGIECEPGRLRLSLCDPSGAEAPRVRSFELVADGPQGAAVPELRARIDPEGALEREVEHFLRRLVRAACARTEVRGSALEAS
jgi:hypothetical protein